MNFDDEQSYRDQQNYWAFADWLGEWLTSTYGVESHRYTEPTISGPGRPARMLYPDQGPPLAIWICLRSDGELGARREVDSMKFALANSNELKGHIFVLASPEDVIHCCSDLPYDKRVKIIDASYWLQNWENLGFFGEGIVNLLRRRLRNIPTGGGGPEADYEQFVNDLLYFIFSPNLGAPNPQSYTRKHLQRRDAIIPINLNRQGIWTHLGNMFKSINLVAEAKNLSTAATTEHVNDAAKYIGGSVPGNISLLATRLRPSSTAYEQAKWLTHQGRLVIPICDEDVYAMLDGKFRSGWGIRTPDDIINAIVSDLHSG